MHRDILRVTKLTDCVDHINHNGLDNQKFNLRICLNSENIKNRNGYGKSKFLGVYLKRIKPISDKLVWAATISINKRGKHIGYFETEEGAAHAYDAMAKIHHGEFANLNFKD